VRLFPSFFHLLPFFSFFISESAATDELQFKMIKLVPSANYFAELDSADGVSREINLANQTLLPFQLKKCFIDYQQGRWTSLLWRNKGNQDRYIENESDFSSSPFSFPYTANKISFFFLHSKQNIWRRKQINTDLKIFLLWFVTTTSTTTCCTIT